MDIKRFLIIFVVLAVLSLIGCQNDTAIGNDLITVSGETATLRLNVNIDSGRSAMPEVTLSDINSISLFVDNTGKADAEILGTLVPVGWWTSIDEMQKDVIPYAAGEYTFTLACISDNIVFSDSKTVTISSGANSLTFTPKMEFANELFGEGNLSVSIRYDAEDVALVTGGLYSMDGDRIAGYSDQSLTIKEGGNSIYEKENVPSGSYILIFKFYADTEKTMPRGTYREYCSIVNGKTSSSACEITSLSNLFKITYELNGGSFVNGFTSSGNYTRQTATITLPQNTDTITNISKKNCTFGGWYESEDFSGKAVTEIPSGSTGDKTLYARWLENATITFKPNKNGASLSANTQAVIKGVQTALTTVSVLGLTYSDGRFLGWAETPTAAEAVYADGDAITVTKDTTLYAVWSISSISPSSESDSKDTDGDGLTDWDELHKYFTDPANKDTDGDGWSDGDEVNGMYTETSNTFNPLIADTPQLGIRMTAQPTVSYIYSLTDGSSKTESVSENSGTVSSKSNTNSNSKSHSETHGWGFKFGQQEKWGEKFEFTLSEEESYNGSVTNGDSYTYSTGASESWSKSWSNGKSTTSTESKTISGGKIEAPVRFKNESDIAYTVEHVTVALYRIPTDSGAGKTFVKNMTLTNENVFTIPPRSESGDFLLTVNLSVGATEQLMKFSRGFTLEVAGYKITLQKDGKFANDFTEALTHVKAKTAAVYIDWGNTSGRSARTYNVAVKNQYNTEATNIDNLYTAPSLDYIFRTILHYKKGTDYTLNENGCIQKIYGIENQDTNANGAWFICRKYTASDGTRRAAVYSPYTTEVIDESEKWSLDKISINAGDEVSVIYTVDKDKDGVPLNEELIYGTSDDKSDSDGDGLDDYDEIYGWYKDGIGLDPKYSENNKVYTNPMLADSDGDDLLDYSTDAGKQDNDPQIPKMKNDTSLKTVQYSVKSGGAFTDFSKGTSTDYVNASSITESSIWLNIEPKPAFASIQYSFTQGGPYMDLYKTTELKLNVGQNMIYVQCTAPDELTKKEYSIEINSAFRQMKNFKVTNDKYEGGRVRLTWDSYVDARAGASDGGYILYGKKEYVTKTLELSDIAQASKTIMKLSEQDEFFLLLEAETLSPQGYYLLDLASKTEYTLCLFSYAHSGNAGSFKSAVLGSKQLTTALTKTATLKFYAHFVKGVSEHDSGSEGEYYWTVSDNTNYLGLNDLSKGSSSSTVDLEDGWCYSFGTSQVNHSEPAKFGNSTKTFEHTFDRRSDYSFTVTWTAKEDDPTNTDGIGTVTSTFKYKSSSDTWSCEWSASGGDGSGSSGSGSYLLKAGERSAGNKWELHNSSKGEIDLHWDWGWDE